MKQEVLTTLPNSLPKILVLILLKKRKKKKKKDYSIKHLIVKKKKGNNDKMHGWLLGSSVTYVMYLMPF